MSDKNEPMEMEIEPLSEDDLEAVSGGLAFEDIDTSGGTCNTSSGECNTTGGTCSTTGGDCNTSGGTCGN